MVAAGRADDLGGAFMCMVSAACAASFGTGAVFAGAAGALAAGAVFAGSGVLAAGAAPTRKMFAHCLHLTFLPVIASARLYAFTQLGQAV